MHNIIEVGGVRIRVPACPDALSAYIPNDADAQNYVPQGDEMTRIAGSWKLGKPFMLIGGAGSGKNTAIRHFFHLIQRPLLTVSLSEGTTTDHLIGAPVPVPLPGGGFTIKWADGVLTKAVRTGCGIILDEMNGADQRTLFRIRDFLANNRTLTLYENPENPSEVIRPLTTEGEANGFAMFATANPASSGLYGGTTDWNFADIDRWTVHQMDYVGVKNPDGEAEALTNASGCDPEVARGIVKVMNIIRQRSRLGDEDLKAGVAPLFVEGSSRSARDIAEWSTVLPVMEAVTIGYLNKVSAAEDRVVIERLFLDQFATKADIAVEEPEAAAV